MNGKSIEVPIPDPASLVAASSETVSVSLGRGPLNFGGTAYVDIVFVIDTTGSMENEIDGLLATSQKFVDRLAKKQIDWRIAIESFGDLTVTGDRIEATSFSKNVELIKRLLREIPRNSGGGNDGESSLEALLKALNLSGFRQNAIKVFILMTDEPALQTRQLNADMVIETLRRKGVITFVISGPFDYFKRMAKTTGASWFQISSGTDFLSILETFSKKVSQVIDEVQRLADGNVQKYLQLKSGG
ncbi:MAG: hypothetical protein A2Z42_04410 [Candidatus Woykebacteria bacterium RBG_19FT_COMBO_43_10]|uniref:VWFA domain-containing protein n=1 Tax=Candidatus Woykebacteria bacterium RBG_19FT_COMBO_43_10 TaxID=1802598 RepID=A0A1G1WF28_9BACT|nr:MAG: hypothetical protein A2Z42_04410 [Candidatus Woykebacteria bacterium RBG_19FT_COMBO_43_10]